MDGRRFLAHPRRALAVAAVLVLLVLLLAAAVPSTPLGVDTSWSEAMLDLRSAPLDRVAHWFDRAGSGILRGVTIAAVCAALAYRRRLAALIAFGAIQALTPLFVNGLKAVVDRPRPPHALITAAASSFPSGHAAYAAATAVSLIVLFTTGGRARAIGVLLAVTAVAGMVWSRTYLQVHWLSDALAGAALGAGVALGVLALVQLAVGRFRPRRPWSCM